MLMTTAYRWLRYEAVPQIRHVWTNLFRYKPFRFVEMDYEEYWREGHSSGRLQDPRVRAFGRIVERGASVGEIGCGDGTLLEYLRDHNGARVKGYDVSEHAIARTRARDIDAEVWDARAGALDGTFD
jgi:2-polyprenyl-3-methyl-5-hydroxy-6-metoxy-1,4-benzoquinol methylase